MSICIETAGLSKHFRIPISEHNLFSAMKSVLNKRPLFSERLLFKDVRFSIKEGEKAALIGINGSGKTTLLRILCGIYKPSTGMVRISAEPNAIFQNWIDINADASVLDNVRLLGMAHGLSRSVVERHAQQIVTFAELTDIKNLSLKMLSLGQQQRLALSVFLHAPSSIVFLDDCMTVIDNAFEKKFERHFRSFSGNKTCVLASHNHSLLSRYCETGIVISNGRVQKFEDIGEAIAFYETGLPSSDSLPQEVRE